MLDPNFITYEKVLTAAYLWYGTMHDQEQHLAELRLMRGELPPFKSEQHKKAFLWEKTSHATM